MPALPVAAFAFNSFAAALPPATGPAKTGQPVAAAGTFDELDIEVAGVRSKGDDVAAADGFADPTDESQAGSMATFPVAPQRLAQERAQAAALGLAPSGGAAGTGAAPASRPGNDLPITSNQRFGKVYIIDASEGTSLDPLRNKTYDLNSTKTVPVLRALPPIAPSAN